MDMDWTADGAPNGPPTSFPDFLMLPFELRDIIWRFSATNNGQGHIIDVCFEGKSFYQQGTRRINNGPRTDSTSVRYKYRMFEVNQPGTLLACKESRIATRAMNKSYLQLNQGYKIYFNPRIDTIFFDMMDIFHIHTYSTHFIARNVPMALHGFESIIHLATTRVGNFRALQDLRTHAKCGPLLPNVLDPVHVVHRRVASMFALKLQLHAEAVRVKNGLRRSSQHHAVLNHRDAEFARANVLFHRIP